MNIFVLDKDPKLAAAYHNDKHVVKMISESRQMMQLAFDYYTYGDFKTRGYVNHPCSVWIRKSKENYKWLFSLATHLNDEYKSRFQKDVDHKSYLQILALGIPERMPCTGLTQFAMAMPDQYKNPHDPIQAYRDYYFNEKRQWGKKKRYDNRWRNGKPRWWLSMEESTIYS